MQESHAENSYRSRSKTAPLRKVCLQGWSLADVCWEGGFQAGSLTDRVAHCA